MRSGQYASREYHSLDFRCRFNLKSLRSARSHESQWRDFFWSFDNVKTLIVVLVFFHFLRLNGGPPGTQAFARLEQFLF
jgi:hypothetical protein